MQMQFTGKAQNALTLAEKCAKQLKQGYVGTEHILVGLTKEGSGVAAKGLSDNGVTTEALMKLIKELIVFESGVAVKEREGFSPRATKVLEDAHKQAKRFGQKKTGTEHILLALIRHPATLSTQRKDLFSLTRATKKIWKLSLNR